MAKDCIICRGPTGSREHIFPATLGGRRTNKGIYCGTHNGAFSPLANVLAEQLRPINALLSVWPDHGDGPTAVVLDGAGGEKFELSGTTIKPVLSASGEPLAEGEVREVAFASEAAAQQWVAQQRAAGHDVRLAGKEKRTRYLTQPIHIPLTLGGTRRASRDRICWIDLLRPSLCGTGENRGTGGIQGVRAGHHSGAAGLVGDGGGVGTGTGKPVCIRAHY